MTDQTATIPAWQDGDPTMEAIATAVYEHCEVARGTGLVIDDPRNIAAAAVAGIRDAARQAAGQPAADEAPQYGVNGCTCRPWTNRGDGARWCTPDDTVDMVAGWDPGPGCPRHPAAGLAAPTNHTTEDRRRLAAVERLCSGRPGYHTVTVKQLLTAMSDAAGAES